MWYMMVLCVYPYLYLVWQAASGSWRAAVNSATAEQSRAEPLPRHPHSGGARDPLPPERSSPLHSSAPKLRTPAAAGSHDIRYCSGWAVSSEHADVRWTINHKYPLHPTPHGPWHLTLHDSCSLLVRLLQLLQHRLYFHNCQLQLQLPLPLPLPSFPDFFCTHSLFYSAAHCIHINEFNSTNDTNLNINININHCNRTWKYK